MVDPEHQQEENQASQQQQPQQVHTASLKLPEFWRANPQVWFLRLEAQFRSHRITSDNSKFDTVIGALDCDTLTDISDILINPPNAGKYEAIKQRLTAIYADSETKTIQKLLSGLSLGDAKPSQLLHKMQNLNAGNKVDEAVLRTLWLERLPHNLRPILSVSSESLANVATMADKIHEAMNGFAIAAIQDKPCPAEIQELKAEIAELKNLIMNKPRNNRQRSRSRGRYQHRPATPTNSTLCWYHSKFGSTAQKCRSPCSYQPAEN